MSNAVVFFLNDKEYINVRFDLIEAIDDCKNEISVNDNVWARRSSNASREEATLITIGKKVTRFCVFLKFIFLFSLQETSMNANGLVISESKIKPLLLLVRDRKSLLIHGKRNKSYMKI